jgi:hypothetical protein
MREANWKLSFEAINGFNSRINDSALIADNQLIWTSGGVPEKVSMISVPTKST